MSSSPQPPPAGRKRYRRPPLRPTFRMIVRNWWPVVFWLGIIRVESTDYASAANTWSFLYRLVRLLNLPLTPYFVWQLDEVLRKVGHFLGYGILSALVFFALRNTYRDRIRPVLLRTWGTKLRDVWRWEWVLLGIAVTMITASADEIHQSYIASRTGKWQDVVLDTCGAMVIQALLYGYSRWYVAREQAGERAPRFAPSR